MKKFLISATMPPVVLIALESALLVITAWQGKLTTEYLLQALYVVGILVCWLATMLRVRDLLHQVEKLQKRLNSYAELARPAPVISGSDNSYMAERVQ